MHLAGQESIKISGVPVTAKGGITISNKLFGEASTPDILMLSKNAAKRAGLSDSVSTRWLQRAHASHSLDRGAPISLVQATLGHYSVATTGRYLHARPKDSSARHLEL